MDADTQGVSEGLKRLADVRGFDSEAGAPQ